DQGAGVIFAPGGPVGAEIAAERLLAPGAIHRADNRGERAGRTEPARVPQADGERAMPAHRMAGDALPRDVDREVGGDQFRQLALDIGTHAEIRSPWFPGRID